MESYQRLISLYCNYPTKLIEETDGKLLLNAFGVDEPAKLLEVPGYLDAFTLVSECALVVDDFTERYPQPKKQVRESLRIMRQKLDEGAQPRKLETLRSLIEGRLRRKWPVGSRAVYDEKKEILEWRDFFVSYTNRDAPATNQQFKDLIKGCLGFAPKGAQLQANYLARVVTRHLRRYQGLTGFFEEDGLRVGENIQEEVKGYCTKAFALVQIIEPLVFDREPPTNWCHYEYACFSDNPSITKVLGPKDRHFFILTDPEIGAIQPAAPYPPFDPWMDRIKKLKHIALRGERNITLREKVREIATQILALRKETIESWLA